MALVGASDISGAILRNSRIESGISPSSNFFANSTRGGAIGELLNICLAGPRSTEPSP